MQATLFYRQFLPQALSALLLLCSSVLYAADGDTTNDTTTDGNPVPAGAAALPDEQNTGDGASSAGEETLATDQNAPMRVIPDVAASRHEGLLQYLQLNNRQYEMVRLVAAESEFYGLLLTETRGQPQGGVLILHDNGQHSHWPEIVAPLRETLPAHGWTTLSIELPELPAAQPPARTPDTEYSARMTTTPDSPPATAETTAADAAPGNAVPATPAADAADSSNIAAIEKADASAEQDSALNATEPALPRLSELPPLPANTNAAATPIAPAVDRNAEYREQMLTRIRQGVSYLNQRGQLNIVVIACGNSANWAVDFLLARSQSQPQAAATGGTAPDQAKAQERGLALILIDAVDNSLSPVPLNQQMVQLDMPLLDLISEQSISPAYANQQRAGAMRHKQRQQYQQIAVPAFDLNYDDSNVIVRRVRGWLKTNAAGTELATKTTAMP